MDLLAEAGGLKLWMDDSWSVSFFSSPYVGHRLLSAVDIYQGADFGEEAFSPVSGVVHKIMRFDSPSPGGGSLPEYLILIGKNHSLARIMHVEPSVSEGELVRVGEPIGIFIKNGFFSYWVDAGMHVEVRKKTSIMRSTGGLELKPAPALTETNGYSDESVSLKGRVMRSTERNTVVELNHENNVKVGDKLKESDIVSFIAQESLKNKKVDFSSYETLISLTQNNSQLLLDKELLAKIEKLSMLNEQVKNMSVTL